MMAARCCRRCFLPPPVEPPGDDNEINSPQPNKRSRMMASCEETPPQCLKTKNHAVVTVVNAQAIRTVHGIMTETDGMRDDDIAGGKVVVVAFFSLSFALPSPPALARGKIHATPTTTAMMDINDLAAGQTSLLVATAMIDASVRDEKSVRGVCRAPQVPSR